MHRGRVLERTPAETFFRSPSTSEALSYLQGNIVF
jgi:hypothetical protein